MENRLDNLFRNKLSKHEESPSPQAWDQIHGNLASTKRKIWTKRLAIAASILLFATVGYVSFRSLDSLNLKKNQHVAQSIDPTETLRDAVPSTEELTTATSNSNEKEVKTAENQGMISEEKDIEKSQQAKFEKVSSAEKIEIKEISILADLAEKEPEAPSDINIVELDIIDDKLIVQEAANEVVLAKSIEQKIETSTSNTAAQKKSYGQVKVIYKASSNSSLIVAEKRKITDKGIDKITKFSNEHLLTADRKTKLRNTKEDLFAMNFGKLLTKTNKEIEN